MASLAAGIVDPTKAGKYPVVLSDALLGKDPKEIFTGIRYNHKPTLSSSTAPHQARIKTASSSSKKGAQSYDLSFQDDGGRYDYKGTRGNEDKQYVLIFDPERQVFVLHKVDSMFNMNLVRTPSNNDAESLRQEYPQLESHKDNGTATTSKKAAAKDGGAPAKSRKPAPKETKKAAGGLSMPEKKAAAPLKPSPLPKPKPKPNARKPVDVDSEDESSDDDLLTIEDPGGAAPSVNRDFSPGFMDKPRPFSEFVQQQEEEEEGQEEQEEDADGEDEDDDDAFEHFKLPSPINRQMQQQTNNNSHNGINNLGNGVQSMQFDDDEEDEEEEEEEEMEDVGGMDAADSSGEPDDDLEAALLAELGEGGPAAAEKEESDVSEEE
ncbi:RNA polymerase II transcription elongation factor-domain-containing protein [Biscogniauxia mediterranea]|nr:RNA polymerase II transcription elongation factor-domain-containing protein [Biscogniauxia mediterranea]